MSRQAARGRAAERGATLSEYGLVVALVVVVSIGALALLQDESGSYLADTGSDIGQPRELAADIDPDLPTPPPWLTQPPPPTTTTTTTTTTTSSSTSSTSTSSSSTSSSSTSSSSSSTSSSTTTAPSPPTGSVVLAGAISDLQSNRCYAVASPGVVGSSVDRQDCTGDPSQNIEAVGGGGIVAFRFTDPANAGLCVSIDPNDPSEVLMAVCDDSALQQFSVVDHGGSYSFASVANGLCLSGSSDMRAQSCNGDNDRKFVF